MANDSKYKVLVDTLKSAILSGKYDLDRPFPSERMLIRKYGHSRITVQHALRELERLGFVSRQQGRGTFVTKQGVFRKIGLILPGISYAETVSRIASEIARLAVKESYILMLGTVNGKFGVKQIGRLKRFARELVRENVAGVLFQPIELIEGAERFNREITSVFDKAKIPIVMLNYDITPLPERSGHDVVGVNNVDAGHVLGKYLLSIGAKRIQFFLRPNSSPLWFRRMQGVMSAVNLHGFKSCAFRQVEMDPEDYKALVKCLKKDKPDVIVTGGELAAATLLQSLKKLGLSIPEDVMVASFDDTQIASHVTPRLTTMRQDCELVANTAFYRLLERIANPSLTTMDMLLPMSLVVRESACDKKI